MGDWNSPPVPTFTAGQPVFGADLQKLADIASALTLGASTWSPTLTNLTLGSGTQTALYRRTGQWVDFYFSFTYGAGSAVGTAPTITLPVAPAGHYVDQIPATGELVDLATSGRVARVVISSGSTVLISFWNATPAPASITSTAPWTWTTGDRITIWGRYETT